MSKNRRLAELAGLIHRSTVEESKAVNESRLLVEEDDLFGDDEEAGDDEEDAEGDDEAADDEETADAEEEEEEEPADKLSAKEISELGPGEIDIEIDSIMDDIFSQSSKSIAAAEQVTESIHRNKMSSLMFESPNYDAFDMDRFARETARYINNYQNLLDVEGMLYNKAKKTLLQQFGDMGKTAVADFEEHMDRVHGINLSGQSGDEFVAPIAVGAGGEGGA